MGGLMMEFWMEPEADKISKPSDLIGVILAAGKGVRAYPATRFIPKALLDIGGKALIERNIEIMRDQLGIRKILIVIGHLGNQIIHSLNPKALGVDLTYVEQKEQKGIGNALLTVEKYVAKTRFVVMLADEFYVDSNHNQLHEFLDQDIDAVLMFKKEKNKAKIANNFTGQIHNGKVLALIEKPAVPDSRFMGVGTYLLNDKVFGYIRNTRPSMLRQEVEITDVLSNMAKHENVFACTLSGIYVNVNSTDDLNYANYALRERFFDQYKVSVVIPAYNEEETITEVVEDFKTHPAVDEVLVVDNNSRDATHALAVHAGARVVTEKAQGYGCAMKCGLDEAKGDIIILTEADGSFQSKDIPKFLEYLKDCDMAIGTRTTRQMIEQGANMGSILRWGNVLFGKIVEALWWNLEPRFTDVGCTYRAIWKTSYHKIRPYLKADGPEFAPEMMIAILICRRRIIEIPVSYRKRFGGESKHSGHFRAHARTAMKMLRIILQHRFRL